MQSEKTVTLKMTFAERLCLFQAINFSKRCGHCHVDIMATTNVRQMRQQIDILDSFDLNVFESEFEASRLGDETLTDYTVSEVTAKRLFEVLKATGHIINVIPPYVLAYNYKELESRFGKVVDREKDRAYALTLTNEERELIAKALRASEACLACGTPKDGFKVTEWNLLHHIVTSLGLEGFLLHQENYDPGPLDCQLDRDAVELLLGRLEKRAPLVTKSPRGLFSVIDKLERMKVGEIAPIPE